MKRSTRKTFVFLSFEGDPRDLFRKRERLVVANTATVIGVILAIIGFRAAIAVWPSIVNFYGSQTTAERSSVADRGSMSGPVVNTEGAANVTVNIIGDQTMTNAEVEIEED